MKKILRQSVNFLPYRFRQQIRYLPVVAALQRFLIDRMIARIPFVHTINAGPAAGLKFEVVLPQDKLVWAGTYEREFSEAIVSAIKSGDVCYDIGAYRGYVSGAMALKGASRVIIFEPLPANLEALRRLATLNPSLPLTVIPAAAGNADGLSLFKIMPDQSMGKLAVSSFQASAAATGELTVSIRRVDTVVANKEIPPPDIIKIDVEGAELEVIEGAIRTIQSYRPQIFIEAHSSALESACSQRLIDLGYTVRRLGSPGGDEEATRHLSAY